MSEALTGLRKVGGIIDECIVAAGELIAHEDATTALREKAAVLATDLIKWRKALDEMLQRPKPYDIPKDNGAAAIKEK